MGERDRTNFALGVDRAAAQVAHAARNYRRLREIGITIRNTAAIIIATFSIEHGQVGPNGISA